MTGEAVPTRPCLALVVAMSRNACIGRDGDLPWHLPEDLRHFRRVTKGHAVLMGRRTHLSIGRALPGRRNIVVTSRPESIAPGCEAAPSLSAALAEARKDDDCPRVIGGSRLFAEALPAATRLYLTEVDQEVAGDTFFPAFDRSTWTEVERRPGETPGVSFVLLERP